MPYTSSTISLTFTSRALTDGAQLAHRCCSHGDRAGSPQPHTRQRGATISMEDAVHLGNGHSAGAPGHIRSFAGTDSQQGLTSWCVAARQVSEKDSPQPPELTRWEGLLENSDFSDEDKASIMQ